MKFPKMGKKSYLVLGLLFVSGCIAWFKWPPAEHVTLVWEQEQEVPEGVHEFGDVVLECMDPRFHKNTAEAVAQGTNTTSFDLLASAGASLGYSDPLKGKEYWRDWILDHVDVALQLHHAKRLKVVDHMQCAAYGIRYNSRDKKGNVIRRITPKEEERFHEINLRKLRRDFRKSFPHLEVRLFLAKIVKKDGKLVHEYHEIDPLPKRPEAPELHATQPQGPPSQQDVH